MKTLKRFLWAILFLLSHTLFAQDIWVAGISDGDSFTALFDDFHKEKIRIYGIDCPERGQPFFAAAKQYTAGQIFRKKIHLKVMSRDRYGRKVAMVYLPDGKLLNEKLLANGIAWHFTAFDKNPAWSAMERAARIKKLGLWNSETPPTPPWAWRKQKIQKPATLL